MNAWQIGDVKITRIIELQVSGGSKFILPDATREAVQEIDWLAPHFAEPDGRLIMSIHALIIESGDRRIMVDTCLGNDKERAIPGWNMRHGPFLEDIAAAGYPRESIDTVLCTHLHVDHVGWNTMWADEKWVPTFPNARYLFGRTEWEHWSDENHPQKRGEDIIGDSVKPIVDAGLADLVDSDHKITDEIWLEPTPGHTPGHVSVRISSRGEDALITGDFMHHPCQMARPDWRSAADYDGEWAEKTRNELLQQYADQPVLVIGTHFATPTAGHILRDGNVYRFKV
ncbi:MAG: MBL fold metallo-hydrolase [Rhodospirillaceae bacterium]|jgi:glyoxylase-like metal-dependent hydrolase (beta-lactamase superfamily II)|nr:MBL fold metallo-hydrolase [Rhodospirillaceae bacterium]